MILLDLYGVLWYNYFSKNDKEMVIMSFEIQLENLNNRITDLEVENQRLHETVEYLTGKLYGRSTEKTSTLAEGQMSLFDETEIEADPTAPEPDINEVKNHHRKKYKGQRAELLKDLPRLRRLSTLAEDDRYCEACNDDLVSVGEEFVRTEIEFIPAKVKVIDYYRETFECRTCRKNGDPYMEKSPMNYPVIHHSMASPTSVAWIAHQKFVNAMPLYRQEKEWQLLGIKLGRATMSNWLIASTRDWLIPIVNLMHSKLLNQSHLHVDETVLQVMKESGRKNTTKSYMWVYGSGKSSSQPIRIFEYQPGRSGIYPKEFLEGYNGFIHTDAYAGYNKVPNITRCLCWAHLRRKFVDALPSDLKDQRATLPNEGINFCNRLFAIEKQLEHLASEERKIQRLKQEKPVLEAFWAWIESTLYSGTLLPKGKLITAFNYARNHKEEFMNYLLDGNCVLSNNLAENSIRPFTIGRKNWLFSGSPKGARTSAAIYSIIETAKANGLIPYKYLKYIFEELPGVQFEAHPEFLEDYLPWNEEAQLLCK